jgi:hypothetical protein
VVAFGIGLPHHLASNIGGLVSEESGNACDK